MVLRAIQVLPRSFYDRTGTRGSHAHKIRRFHGGFRPQHIIKGDDLMATATLEEIMNALRLCRKTKGDRFVEDNVVSIVQGLSCRSSPSCARWCHPHRRRSPHHPAPAAVGGSSSWHGYHSCPRNALQMRQARIIDDAQKNGTTVAWRTASSDISILWICSLLGSALIVSPNAAPVVAAEPAEGTEASDELSDPYSPGSLPVHDEETTCFLCRTNRQGPCRPFWRPLEHCVQDQTSRNHDGSDTNTDGDRTSICDRYVRPFEECWSRHAALYLLISHSVTKDMQVDRIERDHETRTVKQFTPTIDWTGYKEFCQGTEERHESEGINAAAKIAPGSENSPLWERFDRRQFEPAVTTITAEVPIKYEYVTGRSNKRTYQKTGTYSKPTDLTLRAAYALDQDGNVMGYTEYSDKDNKESRESHNGRVSKILLISLLPGYTESFRIKVLYAEGRRCDLISTPCIPLRHGAKEYEETRKPK